MSANSLLIKAKSVAVVGAGSSGVVVAKYLRAEKAFDRITLFEQRSGAGGIWKYTPDLRNDDFFSVPQVNPDKGHQKPFWKPDSPSLTNTMVNGMGVPDALNGSQPELSFISPIYETLETNIPTGSMDFQGLDWPDTPLFPPHVTVLKYIEDYTKDVEHLIQYETQVTNIVPADASKSGAWFITSRNIRTKEEKKEQFDAVIVANGQCTVPYIPDIEGLKEWNDRHPGRITHSKYFRRPEEFTNKKVIVIGAFASGTDLSGQISLHSQTPLLWSTRSETLFSSTINDPARRVVPEIIRFVPETRGVVFKDGTTASNIDAVMFATGYFHSLPFLANVSPKLITDGSRVNHTYQHIFYRPRPTLSFLVLNQRVVPFRLAEAQAAVIARVCSGRLRLPSDDIMKEWEHDTIAEMGDGRQFHTLNVDGEYMNQMAQWAMSAPRRRGKEDGWAGEPLENDGQGKIPPTYSDQDFWAREQLPAMRKAYAALGKDRFKVRAIEQLGFNYEEYLKEKRKEEAEQVNHGV